MSKTIKILSALFIIVGVLFYSCYIYTYSVNFPFQDDTALIDFINSIQGNSSLSHFINELFRVDNDHCMVVPRLISLLDYSINSRLNFKSYILLACFQTILIFFFLYQEFKKIQAPLYMFLPVVLWWLQPQYYEVSNWALTSIQHTSLVVYLFIALKSIKPSRKPKDLLIPLLFASLATFTHGNGILVFGAIGFYLLIEQRYKEILWVILGFALNIILYFNFYIVGQATSIPKNYLNFITSFVALLGGTNMAWPSKGIYLSITLGLLIGGSFMYLFIRVLIHKNQQKTNPILLALSSFVIMTVTLISFARSWMGLAVASRYEFYSALIISCMYLLILPRITKLRTVFVGIALSYGLLFSVSSYFFYTQNLILKKESLLADCFNWNNNRGMLSVEAQFVKNASPFLLPATQKGIMSVPNKPISRNELEKLLQNPNSLQKEDLFYLNKKEEKMQGGGAKGWLKTNYVLESKDFPKERALSDECFLVLFDKKTDKIYLSALESPIYSRAEFISKKRYFMDGSKTSISPASIQSGTYELYFLRINHDKKDITKIDKSITVNEDGFLLGQDISQIITHTQLFASKMFL